jgi:hypothetical protein
LRTEAEFAAVRALDRFEDAHAPLPCGVPNAGESPNLLLGLAGIGYLFLRLYDSSVVPTILLPSDGSVQALRLSESSRATASAPRRRSPTRPATA